MPIRFHKVIIKLIYLSAFLFSILPVGITSSRCYGQQISIHRVDAMPNMPSPYNMRNWKQVAQSYDAFTFSFTTTGQYLPIIWWDSTEINYPRIGFGQPSYVGSPNQTTGSAHEAICCLGAVVDASLVGIDKSNQNGYNFALMEQNYYNKANGQDLVLDNIGGVAGGSFWYDIFPGILFTQLVSFYPSVDIDSSVSVDNSIVSTMAEKWFFASIDMADSTGFPNYNHTAFNFQSFSPVDNGLWTEPDASAGIAWLEYMAYVRSGKTQSDAITAADWGMQYLQNRTTSPYYEVLMPYGAYLGARMNAEMGTSYDVTKFINWCMESSVCRSGWGVIAQNWNGYDCYGLVGSITDGGGYAFNMDTFEMMGTLTPIPRYNAQYARAIGKYMLNASNAMRLLYANGLPSNQQACWSWASTYDTQAALSYEGIRASYNSQSPYAMGDPLVYGWASTDFALYGGGHVGIAGAIISTTNINGILQLNCLPTDYYHDTAYPTYLYYNPYGTSTVVQINVGAGNYDLYEDVSHSILETNVTGVTSFTIPADSAVVLVIAPTGGVQTQTETKLFINDVIVDYNAPLPNVKDWFLY